MTCDIGKKAGLQHFQLGGNHVVGAIEYEVVSTYRRDKFRWWLGSDDMMSPVHSYGHRQSPVHGCDHLVVGSLQKTDVVNTHTHTHADTHWLNGGAQQHFRWCFVHNPLTDGGIISWHKSRNHQFDRQSMTPFDVGLIPRVQLIHRIDSNRAQTALRCVC